MTDSATTPRIRAADDIEAIYEAIQRHRREKQDALNAPEEGEKPPKVEWSIEAMRADWKQDAIAWQASVARSGR